MTARKLCAKGPVTLTTLDSSTARSGSVDGGADGTGGGAPVTMKPHRPASSPRTSAKPACAWLW